MKCLGVNTQKRSECEIIGSHIIQKNGPNDILLQQAHEYKEKIGFNRDEKKLLNIMFHDGHYYLNEPRNKHENVDNIIDNHLWFIVKFMPKKHIQIGLSDVVRFGRIPFKVAKLVLDVEQ